MELTDAQWAIIEPLIPKSRGRKDRRGQPWREGTLKQLLHALAEDLYERGGLDLTECFIDATFAGAKKGALVSERRNGARAPRSWPLQTARVFLSPLGSQAHRPMRSP